MKTPAARSSIAGDVEYAIPMRPLQSKPTRFFAPGADPRTASSVAIFFSCLVEGLRADLREAAAALLETA
jgi:hypothetical protein